MLTCNVVCLNKKLLLQIPVIAARMDWVWRGQAHGGMQWAGVSCIPTWWNCTNVHKVVGLYSLRRHACMAKCSIGDVIVFKMAAERS